MSDGHSVVLTSAIKQVGTAVYDALKAYGEGKFPGGQIITMDAKTDGIGLPEKNPNLSTETQEKVDQVLAQIKTEEIIVPATADALESYLSEVGYDASTINYK